MNIHNKCRKWKNIHPKPDSSKNHFIHIHYRPIPHTRPLTEQRSERQRARTFFVIPVHEGLAHRDNRHRLSPRSRAGDYRARAWKHFRLFGATVDAKVKKLEIGLDAWEMREIRHIVSTECSRKTKFAPRTTAPTPPIARCLVPCALGLARHHLEPWSNWYTWKNPVVLSHMPHPNLDPPEPQNGPRGPKNLNVEHQSQFVFHDRSANGRKHSEKMRSHNFEK